MTTAVKPSHHSHHARPIGECAAVLGEDPDSFQMRFCMDCYATEAPTTAFVDEQGFAAHYDAVTCVGLEHSYDGISVVSWDLHLCARHYRERVELDDWTNPWTNGQMLVRGRRRQS